MVITMSRPFVAVVTLLLLFLSMTGYGREYPTLHYSIAEGLPSNKIYEIYRDSKGFLWFASDKGIARYNGIKFEKFTTFNGMPDNEVFFFQEDPYGRLWLGSFNGQLCYFKDDTFHNATNTPFLKLPFKASFIKQITSEDDSSLTVLFNEQSVFLNIKNNSFKIFNVSNEYNGRKISVEIGSIKKLADGTYQLRCTDKIIYLNNGKIVNVTSNDSDRNAFMEFCQDKRYLVNGDRIYTLEGKLIKQLKKYPPPSFGMTRVYVNDEYVMVATNNGLFINDSIAILQNCNLSSITQDGNGGFWVSTLENGVYYLSKDFLTQTLVSNLYSGQIKYSCIRKGNVFFVNSENNLYRFTNGQSECLFNYEHYSHTKANPRVYAGYLVDSSYRYYNIYNGNHFVIDNVLAKKPVISRYKDGSFSDGIKYVFVSDSSLYFQSRRSVTKINYPKLKGGGQSIILRAVIKDDANPYRIFGMAKAPDKSIWYATINALYKIVDTNNFVQKQFGKTVFKAFGFLGQYLVGYTHDNQLLLCHGENGVVMYDTVKFQNCIWEKLYKINVDNMLISTNNSYRIITILHGNNAGRFSVHTVENPFIPAQVESICADSSRCYFFKDGAVTAVDFKSLLMKSPAPTLFYRYLKTNKKVYPVHADIEIPYSEARNISVSFATVCQPGEDVVHEYSATTNNTDNWQEIVGDINLVGAHYGAYTIKIRAKTISSDYSEPVVFTFMIARPYWATLWFIALAVCILIAISAIVIRRRIRLVLLKREEEHKSQVMFMKSEYKVLNALMNPHFIFNTLNNVQSLINENDKLLANKYLRVFANLIRQNMHNVLKDMIPLQREMDLVANYLLLEQLRFDDRLNFKIHIDKEMDISEIMVPPLLIQPLVENSIKHGISSSSKAGNIIEVNVSERDGVLCIEVKDNGRGMGQTQQAEPGHESFGLENIRKRIEQLSIIQNKNITFHISEIKDGGQHQWTIATISIPISEHASDTA